MAEAARTSVADLAYALAEARVPAGFVVLDSDYYDHDGFVQSRVLWHGARGRDFRLHEEPLGSAFSQAERFVDPKRPVRGGIVGSIPSNPDDPPRPYTEPAVSVDVKNATLVSVLNEIVKAAPGTVWVLSRHRNGGESYSLTYRQPGGLFTGSDEPLQAQHRK